MQGLKLLRDFRASLGRSVTLILVLALGTTVFSASFGAYGVLSREIRQAYVETVPASATLEVPGVSREVVERVQTRADIAAATRRGTLHARFRTAPDQAWGNALVFVADDFTQLPMANLRHQRGASSPGADTVLIERSALPLLGGDVGESFELSLPGGNTQVVSISGVVHEAALAPANTHASLYLYASPELARALGAATVFDELRIVVAEGADDARSIEHTVQALARWLAEQGLGQVHEVRIPPPGRHPHQSQMTAVLVLLVIFAGLVFIMSVLLAAAMLTSLLARQVREIGVLKTLGATRAMLTRGYLTAMALLAVVSVSLAWLPARLGTRAWSRAVAQLLNFDLKDVAVPVWIDVVTLGAALVIPLAAALPSILRATRVSVISTLRDFGINDSRNLESSGFWERISRIPRVSNWALVYALRNVVRLRRKLALSVALFAVSGSVAIAAVSVADAWQAWSTRLHAEQVYDLEVTLTDSEHLADARQRLLRLPSVVAVEPWLVAPTAFVIPGQVPVRRTYPDDAHGAFTLVAPPPDTSMLGVTVTAGDWLKPDESDGLVLNQTVPGQAAIPVGARVTLALEGETLGFRVVGKIEQVGVGATAYVNAATLGRVHAAGSLAGHLRVRANTPQAVASLVSEVEDALSDGPARVSEVMTLGVYENAMVAHFDILVRALFALAALTAVVGTLGLGSTVAVNVLERTRELGVIRAMGATADDARRLVLTEGLLVGGISLLLAVAMGVALAWGLGSVIGRMSFALPLPLTPSVAAIGGWSLTVVFLAAVASVLPARRAAQITVREAVNHV